MTWLIIGYVVAIITIIGLIMYINRLKQELEVTEASYDYLYNLVYGKEDADEE